MKAFLLLVLLVLIAGLSYAQSQEPSPGKGIQRQPVQEKPTARKKPAAQDQRGTEHIPLVIKGIPAEKTPEQAKEDREERNVKAANERGLTVYTGYLAIFTGVLVFVGSIQVILFVWQLRLIRESLRDATIAAEAPKKKRRSGKRRIYFDPSSSGCRAWRVRQ